MDLSKASFILIGADGKPATTTLAELKTALDALDTPIVEQPPVVVTDPPAAKTPLKIETPDYNSETGDLTLKTSGGDGTPIQYYSLGISEWTDKAVLNVGGLRRENKETITIQAKQSGITATPIQFKLSGKPAVTEPPVITKPGTGTVVDRPTSNPPGVQVDTHFIANTPRS